MSYEIITSEKEKSVIVIHTREIETEQHLKIVKEVGRLLREKKWNRLLVDARSLSSSFSLIEEHIISSKILDLFPTKTRLALLTLDLKKEDTHFIKNLFLNHRMEFEAFRESEKAIAWLFRNEYQTIPQ